MQTFHNKFEEKRYEAVTHDAIERLKRVLDNLAFFVWPQDKEEAKRWIQETKIHKALKYSSIARGAFGDDIRDMANLLTDRWNAEDFAPAALEVKDDLALLSDVESEEEAEEEDNDVVNPPTGLAAQLLQGINRSRNSRGYLTMRLLPTANKRSPAVFGHNGLQIGEYAPTIPMHSISKC
jgi:hypothetical protein